MFFRKPAVQKLSQPIQISFPILQIAGQMTPARQDPGHGPLGLEPQTFLDHGPVIALF